MNASVAPTRSHDHGGSGRDLLLLPGLGEDLTSWSPAIEALQKRDFRPVAMDSPTSGAAEPTQWWAQVFAEIDRAIAEHDLLEPVLMGHSWGGLTAVLYSVQRGRSSLVVNVDGMAVPSQDELAGLPDEERTAMEAAVETLVETLTTLNPPDVAATIERYLQVDLTACYREAPGPIVAVLAGEWERQLADFPDDLAAAVRVIRRHSTAQVYAAAGPNLHIRTLPTGHYVPVEDPEGLAAVVRAELDSFGDVTI